MAAERLGAGIGWRPEIDLSIEALPGLGFVEVVTEHVLPRRLPASLTRLLDRGVRCVPHGVTMSLGGAEPPDRRLLRHAAALVDALGAPVVSDHLAFVRAGGLESGHLLPVARTRRALDVVCANVEIAQAALPVPLAVENVAALVEWPDAEMSEAEFLRRIVERTGVLLILDVANLYANERNFGFDSSAALDELPLDRVAYVHVAGGVERDGRYHDTHAHPVTEPVLDLLTGLYRRTDPMGVLLEYDDGFPDDAHLRAELSAIRNASAVRSADALEAARRLHRDEQARLMQALVRSADPPAGFDVLDVAAQSASLIAKRRRQVTLRRPDLAERTRFTTEFEEFARQQPLKSWDSRRDADQFARWLRRRR